MKWLGVILTVLAIFMLFEAWYDTREGPAIRAACYLAIGAGVFLFFEGLKREIIAALKAKTSDK